MPKTALNIFAIIVLVAAQVKGLSRMSAAALLSPRRGRLEASGASPHLYPHLPVGLCWDAMPAWERAWAATTGLAPVER